MEMTDGQRRVMNTDGEILITGGPGSGKTTISILKAGQIAACDLRSNQKVLFLSFARATVSRVIEAIGVEKSVSPALKRRIDVETYHSFFWRILKAHGYLTGLPRRLHILTPPNEAIALSEVRAQFPTRNLTNEQKFQRREAEERARARLAAEEGLICFDLFAPLVGKILEGSDRIRRLLASMYPTIILDEFQDTNAAQWRAVQELGKCSRLIALADPEQRIYDWIGADPARLDHFRTAFTPTVVDLGSDNHRSVGTDIGTFADDMLAGRFGRQEYRGVVCGHFESFPGPAMSTLVTTIYGARQRLIKEGVKDWSIAILVPTKRMTRLVSDALREPPAGLTPISHLAVIEMEGAILSAEVIASLLQPATDNRSFDEVIDLVCNFFRGKGGDEPSQGALREAASIRTAHDELLVGRKTNKPMRRNSILSGMLTVHETVRTLELTGDPNRDWRVVRRALEEGPCKRLKEIASEARALRLLGRGTQLRQELAQDWRDNGAYTNALRIARRQFVREHFSTAGKPEVGVVVMNMHKAKGKQFDEVIVFEGWPVQRRGEVLHNPDRIVRSNTTTEINEQCRQNMRVSITRGKRRTTILTPRVDRCVLLAGWNDN